MKAVLLGTGNPRPKPGVSGPGVLVSAEDASLLFDCGRGVLDRLCQIQAPVPDIRSVFLTHLHSDHLVGFTDFWLTGWLMGRRAPLKIFGPKGTRAFAEHLSLAFRDDIRIRVADEGLPEAGAVLEAREFQSGPVFVNGQTVVSAFEVDHGEHVKPAFGFRVDHAGRSLIYSGDTRPADTLIKASAGTDVLIHEVSAAPEGLLRDGPGPTGAIPAARMRRIMAHHTSPEQAGEIFSRVKPKLAVFTHVGLFGGLTAADLVSRTRTAYAGRLEVGEDLMTIDLRNGISVHRWPER